MRFLRKELGLSQVELASIIGICESSVRAYDRLLGDFMPNLYFEQGEKDHRRNRLIFVRPQSLLDCNVLGVWELSGHYTGDYLLQC